MTNLSPNYGYIHDTTETHKQTSVQKAIIRYNASISYI